MATTDAKLAERALDALVESGVGFAVLHREQDIAEGTLVSDLDLVVDRRPHEALAAAWPLLTGAGLHPVAVFPYEVDELTVFLCDGRARGAAQVDLLGDARGTSVFGLRRQVLLDRAVQGTRWPTAHPLDELLYLTRKRQVKGQFERVEELRAEAASHTSESLRARAEELFAPPVADAVVGALAGGLAASPYRPTLAYRARTLQRRLRRLRHPAGFWVELVGSDPASAEMATALARRFSLFLVTVRASGRPPGAGLRWWLSHVAGVRWRPGLVVSSAGSSRWPRPDLVLSVGSGDPDALAARTVDAMQRRVERLLRPRQHHVQSTLATRVGRPGR